MAPRFNPAQWLATFAQVGGAYAVTGDRLYLWIIPGDDMDPNELAKARTLVIELTSSQRASVVDHLRSVALVEG